MITLLITNGCWLNSLCIFGSCVRDDLLRLKVDVVKYNESFLIVFERRWKHRQVVLLSPMKNARSNHIIYFVNYVITSRRYTIRRDKCFAQCCLLHRNCDANALRRNTLIVVLGELSDDSQLPCWSTGGRNILTLKRHGGLEILNPSWKWSRGIICEKSRGISVN